MPEAESQLWFRASTGLDPGALHVVIVATIFFPGLPSSNVYF